MHILASDCNARQHKVCREFDDVWHVLGAPWILSACMYVYSFFLQLILAWKNVQLQWNFPLGFSYFDMIKKGGLKCHFRTFSVHKSALKVILTPRTGCFHLKIATVFWASPSTWQWQGVKYGSGCSLNLVKPGARHSGGIGPPRQVHLGAHLSGAGQHFLVQGFAQGWHVAAFYSTTMGSYDHFWSHTGPGGNKSGSENAQQGILKSFCPSPDWIPPTSHHIVVKCSPLGSQINACQGEIKPVIDLDFCGR